MTGVQDCEHLWLGLAGCQYHWLRNNNPPRAEIQARALAPETKGGGLLPHIGPQELPLMLRNLCEVWPRSEGFPKDSSKLGLSFVWIRTPGQLGGPETTGVGYCSISAIPGLGARKQRDILLGRWGIATSGSHPAMSCKATAAFAPLPLMPTVIHPVN